jgi:hypothetical protein
MNTKLKYLLLASFVVWPLLLAAIAACFRSLPTIDSVPDMGPYDDPRNWMGHGGLAVLGNALLLLLVIYAGKYWIGQIPDRSVQVYFFALLVIASLPWLWLFVVLDWRNPYVFRICCWVYDPIGFWFIPAISFIADTIATPSRPLLWYFKRSCIEWLLMVPWLYVWILLSFFVLGGGWI